MKRISTIILSAFLFCSQAFCQERFLPNLVHNWDIAGNIIVSAVIRANTNIESTGYEIKNYWPTQFIDWSEFPNDLYATEYRLLPEPGKEQDKKEFFYLISAERLIADGSCGFYVRARNGRSYCPLFEYWDHKLRRSTDYAFWVVCKEGKFVEVSTKILTQSDIYLNNDNAKPNPKDIWHIEYNDYGAPILIWKDDIRYSFTWEGTDVLVELKGPNFISVHKYVFTQSSDASTWEEVKDYKFDIIDNEFILVGTHLSKAGKQKKQEEEKQDLKQEEEKQDSEKTNDDSIIKLVEVKPVFQGGDANVFSRWINSHLIYPRKAKENGVQGRVITQFTISTDGSVTDVKVLRGIDPALDKEAIRVVSSSPKWQPGLYHGEPVEVTYTFPIIFQLR